jgi:hypothetical protein
LAHKNIKQARIEKKKVLCGIREKYVGYKNRDIFCDIINKTLNTNSSLEGIRDTAQEPWRERIYEIWNQIEDVVEKNNNITFLEQKRREIKQNLDHK